MTKKTGWKAYFRSVIVNRQFYQLLEEDHKRLSNQEISIPERFRIILAEVRKAGHRIDHVLVNREGEAKLMGEPSFLISQLHPDGSITGIGRFMGVSIFFAPQQASMIVFVVETKEGFFTVTGTDIQPYIPGPIFVNTIKP